MSATGTGGPASSQLPAIFGRRSQERYAVAQTIYAADELATLPPGACDTALGLGHPVRWAAPRPGETVLDLGCGGGIDTLLAARAVRDGGGVAVGLDPGPEMLRLAEGNARRSGLADVRWLQGHAEEIPLPDAAVDVVISNGVVNLLPDKDAAFAEVWRVPRPGGRMVMADMVLRADLPPDLMTDLALWAG